MTEDQKGRKAAGEKVGDGAILGKKLKKKNIRHTDCTYPPATARHKRAG
ncbi:MAG: hypothetical protein U9N83_01965 [Thermodesulfobacteriota bacterium]|nr:hypothetical protein [Thermodesulfobacteriota bacterium]